MLSNYLKIIYSKKLIIPRSTHQILFCKSPHSFWGSSLSVDSSEDITLDLPAYAERGNPVPQLVIPHLSDLATSYASSFVYCDFL